MFGKDDSVVGVGDRGTKDTGVCSVVSGADPRWGETGSQTAKDFKALPGTLLIHRLSKSQKKGEHKTAELGCMG